MKPYKDRFISQINEVSHLRSPNKYNKREKFNIFAGRVLAVLTPIAVTRIAIAPIELNPNYILNEAISWAASSALCVLATSYSKGTRYSGFPLTSSAFLGDKIGSSCANRLANKRLYQEIVRPREKQGLARIALDDYEIVAEQIAE